MTVHTPTLYPIPGIDACEKCREPGDAYDENGRWLCIDCMFDEACEPDHDTRAQQAIEKTETDDE
jgi:hypothetical protein